MACRDPHDPPSAPSQHPADEVDVDLIIPEGAEYLGSYDSVPAYLRAMLEPEVSRACGWLLDLLNYSAVQRRWEIAAPDDPPGA